MKQKFFYGRVSSKEQNEARQLEKAKELEIEEKNIYMDKASGKDFKRKEYTQLKRVLRENDILYISSIDRLGRNYEEIKNEWQELTQKIGIDIVVIDMPLLNTTLQANDLNGKFISDLVLQILSYVAETERANIRKRQREGIDIALKEKRPYGRPKQEIDKTFIDVYLKWKDKKITGKKAMQLLNMKPNTFYRRVQEYEKVEQ